MNKSDTIEFKYFGQEWRLLDRKIWSHTSYDELECGSYLQHKFGEYLARKIK